jgi:hypothetical protein
MLLQDIITSFPQVLEIKYCLNEQFDNHLVNQYNPSCYWHHEIVKQIVKILLY